MQKSYRLREKVHDTVLLDLLNARGVVGEEEIDRFLRPEFLRDSHDPFLMPDMDVAVERLRRAAHSGEYICVWSDYDCDGIPGGVALTEFLRAIGSKVRHYIPHRHDEGYGLNTEGIDELAHEGVRLIITVDLGTTDIVAVAHAREKGVEIIITDHHLPTSILQNKTLVGKPHDELPEALAILNPYRQDSRYPFQGLCGAGVAWKLIQGVLSRERFDVPEGKEKWLLDLIGLATLSDMVPLVNENRMLASYGLLVMRKNRRPGLRALLALLRIQPRGLTEDDVGFMVAPRINAASRMDSPQTAARLLATNDVSEADELARALNRINDERKGVVASTVKEARHRLHADGVPSYLIVMGNPNWRPGVLGLVANNLMESEGRPVFLWGREGTELLKGSCRSDGTMNVVEVMAGARDIFEDFGGHEFSGGFSMRQERAHELSTRLHSAYESLRDKAAEHKEIVLDGELSLADVGRVLREISRLAPFGEGNKKPLFLFGGVSVSQINTFGKNKDHLSLTLTDRGATIAGISFFSTPESFQKTPKQGEKVDVVGSLEVDFRNRPRLRIVDVI